jgi:hypothetical protein
LVWGRLPLKFVLLFEGQMLDLSQKKNENKFGYINYSILLCLIIKQTQNKMSKPSVSTLKIEVKDKFRNEYLHLVLQDGRYQIIHSFYDYETGGGQGIVDTNDIEDFTESLWLICKTSVANGDKISFIEQE